MKFNQTILMILCILVTSCSNVKSETSNDDKKVTKVTDVKPQPSATPAAPVNEFKPNFIKATELFKMIEKKENVFVFDVRDTKSFDESHIKSAVSRPLPITADVVKDIPKDAHIVTYCGCPHHLSVIAAEQFTNLGFKSVRVLDEGFWVWKDNLKYPVEETPGTKKVSQISVQGILKKNDLPVVNTDIYMKHVKTGQLEAT